MKIFPLGFPWECADPFLFCAYHDDHYPAGDDRMAPVASLAGREMGRDFSRKDGFSMYHGQVVPGFPAHPHRGFETVTIVRRGLIDHSDSLGAAARFGRGDVQWVTAGRGIVHSEMFPLLERAGENPLELFQIWLNLPHADKLVEPHFAMLWSREIPRIVDGGAEVQVVAGRFADRTAPPPPPKSWAARPDSDVAIWTIKLPAGARLTLPAAPPGVTRRIYYFRGSSLTVDDKAITSGHGVEESGALTLENGAGESELLVLQGRPIGEPVEAYGPFVMNTRAEIQQAYSDYQRTRFGGWPWDDEAPVHPRDQRRFARHADGRVEEPDDKAADLR